MVKDIGPVLEWKGKLIKDGIIMWASDGYFWEFLPLWKTTKSDFKTCLGVMLIGRVKNPILAILCETVRVRRL